MSKIIIGFSKPAGFFEPFSWLIRLVTWSSFSHAYIKYHDSYSDRELIFQASGMKVNFVGETLFKSEEDIYAEFEIEVSEDIKTKIVQFAIDNVGKPYGIMQIIGFAWIYFMRIFGKNVSNPFYSYDSDFCSEISTQILEMIPTLNDTQNPGVVTPKDVYNFVVSKGLKQIS